MRTFFSLLFGLFLHLQIAAQGVPDIVARPIAALLPPISESSGLAFFDGKLFTHNDSGNPSFLFEIDTITGSPARAIFVDIANTDWEDLAHDANYIYIGDMGNNLGNRQNLAVHRVLKSAVLNQDTVSAETISFYYPEQTYFPGMPFETAYDAESLLAIGDSLYIINKSWNAALPNYIYALPKNPGNYAARLVDSIPYLPLLTAADFDTTNQVLYLLGFDFPFPKLHVFQTLSQHSLVVGSNSQHKSIQVPGSIQVEGLAKGHGNSFFLSSEQFQGGGQYLSAIDFEHSLSSVSDLSRRRERVIPNPITNGVIELSGVSVSATISVFDMLGNKQTLKKYIQNKGLLVDLEGLSSGNYLLQIEEEGFFEIIKLALVQ